MAIDRLLTANARSDFLSPEACPGAIGPLPGESQSLASVLLVEDEPRECAFLSSNLTADRFSVMAVETAEEAIELLQRGRPDAAVLDVTLPGMSGLELVSAVREGGVDDPWDPGMPILLVSGHGDRHTAVRGIERGADDFLAKPLHYPELLARLVALIQRARGIRANGVLRVGPLVVDRHGRRALLHGRMVALSAKEFALLAVLAREPRRVLTKEDLLREVWGFASSGRTRTLDSHASRLRRKLASLDRHQRYVCNVWGVGYRLLAED